MPKPKPTQIIRHEIVLGRSERDMVEGALTAYQIGKFAGPLINGIAILGSTLAGTATLLVLYSWVNGWLFDPGTPENIESGGLSVLLTNWRTQADKNLETMESNPVGRFLTPLIEALYSWL
jgi:hypothetical protein